MIDIKNTYFKYLLIAIIIIFIKMLTWSYIWGLHTCVFKFQVEESKEKAYGNDSFIYSPTLSCLSQKSSFSPAFL